MDTTAVRSQMLRHLVKGELLRVEPYQARVGQLAAAINELVFSETLPAQNMGQ